MKTFEDLGFYCVEHLPPVTLGSRPSLPSSAPASTTWRSRSTCAAARRLGDPLAAIDARDRALAARACSFSTHATTCWSAASAQRGGAIRFYRDRLAARSDRRRPAHARAVARTRRRRHRHDRAHARRAQGAHRDRLRAERPRGSSVTVVAFGFKYGLPADLDLLFDVRFLRNPNYVAGTRSR